MIYFISFFLCIFRYVMCDAEVLVPEAHMVPAKHTNTVGIKVKPCPDCVLRQAAGGCSVLKLFFRHGVVGIVAETIRSSRNWTDFGHKKDKGHP